MKLNTITLSLLLVFSSLAQAQSVPQTITPINYQIKKAPHCQNQAFLIDDEKARDIGAALITNNIPLLQHFLSNYCVDGNSYLKNEEFNPIYLVRSNDALRYLLATGIQHFSKLNTESKIDMLSFFMLEEEINKYFIKSSSKFINLKLKEIENKIKIQNLSKSTVPDISYEERNKIINTLLSEYKRNDFFHKDALNNSIATYALMTSEPEVLGKSLTLSPNFALLQKNKDKLSLFQIAMLPKHTVGSPDIKKLKLQAVNNFIMANLNEKNIGMIRYEDLNYVDFASLMKNNNPELYQAILNKFPNITPARFNSMTNEEKDNAKNFFNNFDYVEKIKILSEK